MAKKVKTTTKAKPKRQRARAHAGKLYDVKRNASIRTFGKWTLGFLPRGTQFIVYFVTNGNKRKWGWGMAISGRVESNYVTNDRCGWVMFKNRKGETILDAKTPTKPVPKQPISVPTWTDRVFTRFERLFLHTGKRKNFPVFAKRLKPHLVGRKNMEAPDETEPLSEKVHGPISCFVRYRNKSDYFMTLCEQLKPDALATYQTQQKKVKDAVKNKKEKKDDQEEKQKLKALKKELWVEKNLRKSWWFIHVSHLKPSVEGLGNAAIRKRQHKKGRDFKNMK